MRAFWSSMSEDIVTAPRWTDRVFATVLYPIGFAGWLVAAVLHPADEVQRQRRNDWILAILFLLAGLFIFSQPAVYGAEREWVYDMVEHGHWSVGRAVATCDGPNRVYIVRGDTGVALTVVPNGCAQ